MKQQNLSPSHAGLFAIVKSKSKRIAEGGEGPLGSVSLSSLKHQLVSLTWSRGSAFIGP
jgi:hypothetical protein